MSWFLKKLFAGVVIIAPSYSVILRFSVIKVLGKILHIRHPETV